MLPSWVLLVALAFGLAITLLAYASGHHSGGHINCAVTFGLVLVGECGMVQGFANFVAQLLGSIAGAAILCLIYPAAMDQTGGLGSNGVSEGWSQFNALIGEVMGTFLLMYVVLQTACHRKSEGNRSQAAIAIGFAVFLAHAVLIPIDGCSINPTRSFGPALIGTIRYGKSFFADMWIFWVGPLVGAIVAASLYAAEVKMSSAARSESTKEAPEPSSAVADEAPPIVLLG